MPFPPRFFGEVCAKVIARSAGAVGKEEYRSGSHLPVWPCRGRARARGAQDPPADQVMMIGLGVNVMFGLVTREKLPAKSNTSSPWLKLL